MNNETASTYIGSGFLAWVAERVGGRRIGRRDDDLSNRVISCSGPPPSRWSRPSGQRRGQVGVSRWVGLALCLMLAALHQSALAQQGSGYILGPGDVVKITVFQNPDMTTEARVSEEGKITFPLIGQVEIGGVTPAAAEARIAGRLNAGGFVLNPQVNMVVSQFRSRMVSVLGQVTRPGRYPIEERSATVADMLATAGGVLPTGGDEVVVVRKRVILKSVWWSILKLEFSAAGWAQRWNSRMTTRFTYRVLPYSIFMGRFRNQASTGSSEVLR